MPSRRIEVEIVGDSRSLERAFARSERSARKFSVTMGGIGRAATATALGFVGAQSITSALRSATGAIGDSITAASDLTEQMTRSRVVFGDSADEILAWSKTTDEAMGVSQRAALSATSGFGTMFHTLGLGEEQAAAMSRRFVQLASDMASATNQDPSEMLDRLRSGLAGEAEPLRRFGVLLSEARVKQEALRLGLVKTGAKLTEQQKVLARYSLILRDAAIYNGDFANTSGNLANQQRILAAQLDNLQTQLGTALLPIVTDLVTKATEWLAKTENQEQLTRDLTTVVEAAAAAFETFAGAIDATSDALDAMAGPARKINSFLGRIKGPSLLEMLGVSSGGGPSLLDLVGGRGRGGKAPAAGGIPPGLRGPLDLDAIAAAAAPAAAAAQAAARPGATAEQRNRWFDAMIGRRLDRNQDIATLQGQVADLKTIGGLITARIAATKDVTRRLTLGDTFAAVMRQIRSDQEQIAADAKAAAEAATEKRREAQEAMLDWLEFGADRAQLTDAAADDLKALQKLNRAIEQRIREEGYTLDLARRQLDVQMRLKALSDRAGREEATPFRHLTAGAFLDRFGIGGLSAAQRARFAVGYAQLGPGGSLPGGRTAAFAGAGVTITGPVNIYGVQDVRSIEAELTKRAGARSQTRRGAR